MVAAVNTMHRLSITKEAQTVSGHWLQRISRSSSIIALCALSVAGCQPTAATSYQGYVEGEFLYLAAPQAGYLKSLDAPRGSRVAAGQPVFFIAGDPDTQALAEAEARAGSALEKLKNLNEPHRPPEIAALEANLRAAESSSRLTRIQLKQQQQTLATQGFVSPAKVDEVRSAYEHAVAQVNAAKQQIAAYRATLGRQAEVRGAEADYKAATALAAQKRWVIERKNVAAPAAGEIAEAYYRPGEWVPIGAPVVSLSPDTGRRLRFFVPEGVVATLKPRADCARNARLR